MRQMTLQYWECLKAHDPLTVQKYVEFGIRWEELHMCDCCNVLVLTEEQERLIRGIEGREAPGKVARMMEEIAGEAERRLADPSRNQIDTFLSAREATNVWSCCFDSDFAFHLLPGFSANEDGWIDISRLGDVLLGFFANEDVTFTTTYTHGDSSTGRSDLEGRDITLKKGQFTYAFQGRFPLPLGALQFEQLSVNTDKVTAVFVTTFTSVRKNLAIYPLIFVGIDTVVYHGKFDDVHNIPVEDVQKRVCLHPFRPPYTLADAVRLVQTEWRNSISDPSRMICNRRLLREFEETVADTL
jgi:hypothetical protein